MSNKVKFGLKNVHYAPLSYSEGLPVFGTPVAIPGAVSLTLSPEGGIEPFYADDGAYFLSDESTGYKGSLELALIPESFRIYALDEDKDSNGVLSETIDSTHGYFALLFEFTGDVNKIRHVLYNCYAARPEVSGETSNASKNIKTETLDITAMPLLPSGRVRCKTGDETPASVYNAWYSSVYTGPGSSSSSSSGSGSSGSGDSGSGSGE